MMTRLRLPASAGSAEPKDYFYAKLSFVKLVCEMLPGGPHLRSVLRSQTVCCRHQRQNRENMITAPYEPNQASSVFSVSLLEMKKHVVTSIIDFLPADCPPHISHWNYFGCVRKAKLFIFFFSCRDYIK